VKGDSQTKTGEETIEKINKEALLELYDRQDLVTDYKNVRVRLNDPDISHRDFTTLLKLIWEFTIEKPKTTSEVIDKGLSKFTDEQLEALIEKHKLNDNKGDTKLGVDKEEAQN
jgi:hypothetical protein